jgi:hypothetical protein
VQAYASYVIANRKSALDYFVSEDMVEVIHAEENFAHKTFLQGEHKHNT